MFHAAFRRCFFSMLADRASKKDAGPNQMLICEHNNTYTVTFMMILEPEITYAVYNHFISAPVTTSLYSLIPITFLAHSLNNSDTVITTSYTIFLISNRFRHANKN